MDHRRYYPSPFEQQTLKYGIHKYFSFPERSIQRNLITKEISQKLFPMYPHWTIGNVRRFFNNNRNYYLNTPLKEIQESSSFNRFISEIKKTNLPAPNFNISDSQKDVENSNASNCISKINPPQMHSIATQAFSESSNEKVALMNKAKSINKEKKLSINSKLNESRLNKFEFKNEVNLNDETSLSTVPTFKQYFSDLIYNSIGNNLTKSGNGYRFSNEMIDFSYSIKYGTNPYGQLRAFLPFPSEETLRKRMEHDLDSIQNNIMEDGNMHKITQIIFSNNSNYISEIKIDCIISIDAIEIALFKKSDSLIKNLFIFYLIPLFDGIKPFPIKIITHQTGKANSETLDLIKTKISELFNENAQICPQYIATDGDYGYSSMYKSEFDILYDYFNKNDFNGLCDFISHLKENYFMRKILLIIADMIHFIKNRRTQIVFDKIVMKDKIIPVACLNDFLINSAAIEDKSSLSKLQDTFPIELFNFQIFKNVISSGNFDLALFLFPITCWNECFNNNIVGKETRLFLLQCAIYAFKKFYDIQIKSGNKSEIMPQLAIKRGFATCVLIYKEFKESEGIFIFAKYGTMLQEHFHGVIRGMTHGSDTLENTIRSIVRSNIIADISNRLKNPIKRKTRYSVGGTHYNPAIHTQEYIFDLEPKLIVERLLKLSIYGEYKEFPDLFLQKFISWIDIIGIGSLRIHCTDKHFHYGRRIISREITNFNESKENI